MSNEYGIEQNTGGGFAQADDFHKFFQEAEQASVEEDASESDDPVLRKLRQMSSRGDDSDSSEETTAVEEAPETDNTPSYQPSPLAHDEIVVDDNDSTDSDDDLSSLIDGLEIDIDDDSGEEETASTDFTADDTTTDVIDLSDLTVGDDEPEVTAEPVFPEPESAEEEILIEEEPVSEVIEEPVVVPIQKKATEHANYDIGIDLIPKDDAPEVEEATTVEETVETVSEIIGEEPEVLIQTDEITAEPVDVAAVEEVSEVPESTYDLTLVSRIASTLDALRRLDEDHKLSANAFISAPDVPTRDEYELVFRSLSATQLLRDTMLALISAKNEGSVDRAFYLLGLEDEVLTGIGDLTQSFSESELPETFSLGKDKLPYARKLVDGIEKLSEDSMKHIVATESVLAASSLEEPSEMFGNYFNTFGKMDESSESDENSRDDSSDDK